MTSPSTNYFARVEGGDLRIYNKTFGVPKKIWETNTNSNEFCHLAVQDDGNLVLYSPTIKGKNENPKWASDTYGKDKNPRLEMQDDGNLVLYSSHNHPLWASNTNGH